MTENQEEEKENKEDQPLDLDINERDRFTIP